MRSDTTFSPQSTSLSAAMMLRRACGLSSGATASSRSRNTMSAAPCAAFAKNFGEEPGTASSLRLRRAGACLIWVKLIGSSSNASILFPPRQGMVGLDEAAQTVLQHMRIDLGRRDIGVTQHLLNAAEVGAVPEEVAGEGMAQHMGRDPCGIDAGGERQLLEELAAAPARQMPVAAARGEEEARVFALAQEGPAHRAIGGKGRARRLAQRHEPLLAALAAHDEDALVLEARERQRHQLGDAQPRRIEELDDAKETGALGPAPAPRRGDERRHLLLAKELRQGPAEPRRIEDARRIVAAHALGEEEAVKLAERREPAGAGARRQAGARDASEVAPQRVGVGGLEGDARGGEETREIVEIVAVGGDGETRGAALGREHFEEGLDMPRRRRRRALAAPPDFRTAGAHLGVFGAPRRSAQGASKPARQRRFEGERARLFFESDRAQRRDRRDEPRRLRRERLPIRGPDRLAQGAEEAEGEGGTARPCLVLGFRQRVHGLGGALGVPTRSLVGEGEAEYGSEELNRLGIGGGKPSLGFIAMARDEEGARGIAGEEGRVAARRNLDQQW